MFRIQSLSAFEILDSRGRPTLKTTCHLESGACASASIPSGASTGKAEAHELRDGDASRYRGLGCRKAAANVAGPILSALVGKNFGSQAEVDKALVELDGTPDKSRLGANAILSVSIALARAAARQRGIPLFRHIADLAETRCSTLPRPTINLFSGGKHAGGQAPIQDVLLVPSAARSIDEALATTFAVYQAAADLCAKKYSMRLLRADEGGLAPPFTRAATMLEDAVTAIEAAGLVPGRDVHLAIDVASSHFFSGHSYRLDGQDLTSQQMIELLERWSRNYPVVSIEDGLAEEDWEHWPVLTEKLRSRALVVGDDFLCTRPERIRRAVGLQAASALLLKANQVGTLTETMDAWRIASAAGWQTTVSARSGETEDDWLADFAVGLGAGQIKIGSITQSERLAKYNRLLEIERETGLGISPWPTGL
jgi:enolase